MDHRTRDRHAATALKIGTFGMATSLAVGAGIGAFFPGIRSLYGKVAKSMLADTGHLITRGIPGAAGHVAKSGLAMAEWAMGGDLRLIQKVTRHGHEISVLNPHLRNKIFAGLGLVAAGRTIGQIRHQTLGSFYTDNETMEARHRDDLGATGSLALSMQNREILDSMRHAAIHLL